MDIKCTHSKHALRNPALGGMGHLTGLWTDKVLSVAADNKRPPALYCDGCARQDRIEYVPPKWASLEAHVADLEARLAKLEP